MPQRAIDSSSSTIAIRTRATGLLSRLGHDLEIRAAAFDGHVEQDGERWRLELSFPTAQLRVAGVLERGHVDTSVLSPKDIAEIERKIRQEVFAGASNVTVEGSGKGQRGDLTIKGPKGQQTVQARLDVDDAADGTTTASGTVEVSLKRLGIKEIKAPLGAFKVADGITVQGQLQLLPAAEA